MVFRRSFDKKGLRNEKKVNFAPFITKEPAGFPFIQPLHVPTRSAKTNHTADPSKPANLSFRNNFITPLSPAKCAAPTPKKVGFL
jgi:hypothetical protein